MVIGAGLTRSNLSGQRKVMLFVLNLLWLAAGIALVFPPRIPGSIETPVLITPGIQPTDRVPNSVSTWAFGSVNWNKAQTVSDLSTIKRNLIPPRELVVLGAGLSPQVWQQHPDLEVRFLPSELSDGIQRGNWNQTVTLGNDLRVKGQAKGGDRISLLDPFGTVVETGLLDEDGAFALSATPVSVGLLIYSLRLEKQGETLALEPVPVQVSEPQPIRVSLVAGAPNFETKFLKNWAHEAGIAMLVESQLSTDRTRTEWINSDNKFDTTASDLWIMDVGRWRSLSLEDRDVYLSQVATQGKGLLFYGSGLEQALPVLANFVLSPTDVDRDYTSEGNLITLSQRLTATETAIRQSLVPESDFESDAFYQNHQRGRIGVVSLTNSHQLFTFGLKESYVSFWSAVVSNMLPPEQNTHFLINTGVKNFVGQRNMICFDTPADSLTLYANGQSNTLPLQLMAFRNDQKCLFHWPNNHGWVKLKVGEQNFASYVFDQSQWQIETQGIRTKGTLSVARDSSLSGTNRLGTKPSNRWIWFALFLLLGTVLWWEQKTRQAKPV